MVGGTKIPDGTRHLKPSTPQDTEHQTNRARAGTGPRKNAPRWHRNRWQGKGCYARNQCRRNGPLANIRSRPRQNRRRQFAAATGQGTIAVATRTGPGIRTRRGPRRRTLLTRAVTASRHSGLDSITTRALPQALAKHRLHARRHQQGGQKNEHRAEHAETGWRLGGETEHENSGPKRTHSMQGQTKTY